MGIMFYFMLQHLTFYALQTIKCGVQRQLEAKQSLFQNKIYCRFTALCSYDQVEEKNYIHVLTVVCFAISPKSNQ
jgi:hypothetical protein